MLWRTLSPALNCCTFGAGGGVFGEGVDVTSLLLLRDGAVGGEEVERGECCGEDVPDFALLLPWVSALPCP